MSATIISYENISSEYIKRIGECARKAGSVLPFHRPEIPLTWWTNFQSQNGEPFSGKRGRNFLGANSWLDDFYFLVIEEGNCVNAAIPLAGYSLRIPTMKEHIKMLAFACDSVIIPYQDFLCLPLRREKSINLLITEIINLLKDRYDVVFLGYIPDNSPNIAYIENFRKNTSDDIKFIKCITSEKGGIYPWTLNHLKKTIQTIIDKINNDHASGCGMKLLLDKLTNLNPDTLLFPRNRMVLEKEISESLSALAGVQSFSDEIEAIINIFKHNLMPYPFIQLPSNRESYINCLTKSVRTNLRRHHKKFIESGGSFEKVSSGDLSEKDIEDYLNLHIMRWGDNSVAISDKTRKFHKELCANAALGGYFTLFFARCDGKRVAAQSCFDINCRREMSFSGLDPEYQKHSAGLLLFLETILDAIDNKFSSYDLGLGFGGDKYKMKFTDTYSKTYSYFISNRCKEIDLNRIFLAYECMDGCDDKKP
jgi:hypothetical protein